MGTLATYLTPTGIRAVIEDVVVDNSFRGRGIGEALMRALLDLARTSGARGVSLTSNPRRASANRLYRKMGFRRRQTNSYYFDFGLMAERRDPGS
jgi:ribosomal protein S18 acetylase RimI-like enzyme